MTLLLVLPVMDALVPAPRRDGQPATPRVTHPRRLPAAAAGGGGLSGRPPRGPRRHRHRRRRDRAARQSLVPITTTALGERLGANGQALMTAFAVIGEYARLLVWPARLSPDYSFNQIPLVTSALDGRFLAGVASPRPASAASPVLWRRSPSPHSAWRFWR